jgi:predicted N-acetyltransferase YhbS
MNIRLAKKEEISEVAKVYATAFNGVSKESWTLERAGALLQYWVQKQPDLFFVAVDNGKIIGAITMGIKPWFDGVRLQDGELFVSSEYQKQGVGKLLLKKVLEKALAKYQVSTLECVTFAGNTFPKTWYEKIGLKKSEDLIIMTGNCQEIFKRLNLSN